eukprot:scaffold33152_cov143-Isochrysis_galbana.AAC.5
MCSIPPHLGIACMCPGAIVCPTTIRHAPTACSREAAVPDGTVATGEAAEGTLRLARLADRLAHPMIHIRQQQLRSAGRDWSGCRRRWPGVPFRTVPRARRAYGTGHGPQWPQRGDASARGQHRLTLGRSARPTPRARPQPPAQQARRTGSRPPCSAPRGSPASAPRDRHVSVRLPRAAGRALAAGASLRHGRPSRPFERAWRCRRPMIHLS